MLVIRKEQVKALENAALTDFLRRMMDHLRRNFADELPDSAEVLRQQVVVWIEDARHWGLTQETDVETYLELCAEFPEVRRAQAPAWVAAILSYPGRMPEVKLEKLQLALYFDPPRTRPGPSGEKSHG
jgi:hypothetical protein